MNTVLKHTRIALVALGAFAVATAIGLTVDNVFRAAVIQFHPDGTTLAENFSWMVRQWYYMFPALLIGLVIAKSASFRPPTYLVAMICIQGLVIVRALIFDLSHPVPAWLCTLSLIVTPLPIIVVGWIQIQSPKNIDTSTNGLAAPTQIVG